MDGIVEHDTKIIVERDKTLLFRYSFTDKNAFGIQRIVLIIYRYRYRTVHADSIAR